eukprot:5283577-Alexandrium_andersonii.AAC.1
MRWAQLGNLAAAVGKPGKAGELAKGPPSRRKGRRERGGGGEKPPAPRSCLLYTSPSPRD